MLALPGARDHCALTDDADDDDRVPVNPTPSLREFVAAALPRARRAPLRRRCRPSQVPHAGTLCRSDGSAIVSRRPSTPDENRDRSTALTMIVCPIRSHGTPSRSLRDCPANCRIRSFPPRSSGWALTPFYFPLKSRLYGVAALVVTPERTLWCRTYFRTHAMSEAPSRYRNRGQSRGVRRWNAYGANSAHIDPSGNATIAASGCESGTGRR